MSLVTVNNSGNKANWYVCPEIFSALTEIIVLYDVYRLHLMQPCHNHYDHDVMKTQMALFRVHASAPYVIVGHISAWISRAFSGLLFYLLNTDSPTLPQSVKLTHSFSADFQSWFHFFSARGIGNEIRTTRSVSVQTLNCICLWTLAGFVVRRSSVVSVVISSARSTATSGNCGERLGCSQTWQQTFTKVWCVHCFHSPISK